MGRNAEPARRFGALAERHVGNGNSRRENPSSEVWQLVDRLRRRIQSQVTPRGGTVGESTNPAGRLPPAAMPTADERIVIWMVQ